MLQQNLVLYDKINIALEYDKSFSKHSGFYKNYSRFTLKALRKSSFQEFLSSMLSVENIEEKTVNTVDIAVFPARRKNGFNIVGRCDTFGAESAFTPKPSTSAMRSERNTEKTTCLHSSATEHEPR